MLNKIMYILATLTLLLLFAVSCGSKDSSIGAVSSTASDTPTTSTSNNPVATTTQTDPTIPADPVAPIIDDILPAENYIFKDDSASFNYVTRSMFIGAKSHSNFTVSKDIYVAGFTSTGYGEPQSPVYWQNGVMTTLGTGGVAYSIYVDQQDNVYVAGQDSHGGGYWVNGVQTLFSEPYASPKSIAVLHGDVYVAGFYYNNTEPDNYTLPALWKNGVLQELQYGTARGSANTVFIFQNDIYVAGGISPDDTSNYYGYWKNGTLYAFEGLSPTGIFVDKNAVYLSGCSYDGVADRYFSIFLKNDVKKFLLDEIHLPNAEYLTCPYAIAAKGKSIVAGGFSGDRGVRYASIWGEDIISSLEFGSTVTSIALAENDIFAAGNIGNYDGGTAATWINGIKKTLTTGSNYDAAYSIFVK